MSAQDQKFYEGRLMSGMKMTGIDFLMERSVGKYKQSHDYFAAGIAGQPGLDAQGETSVKDRWEQMLKAFETFGDALGNNKDLINTANGFIDTLTKAVQALNANVEPISKWLAGFGGMINLPDTGGAASNVAKTSGKVGGTILQAIAGTAARNANKWLTGKSEQLRNAEIIIAEGRKKGMDDDHIAMALGIGMQESGLRSHGPVSSAGARGLTQIMPFGTRTAGFNVTDAQAYNPTWSADYLYDRMKLAEKSGKVSPYNLPDATQRSGDPFFNAKVAAYAAAAKATMNGLHVTVDVKGVPKHLVETTVAQVHKQSVKSGIKASNAMSQAGGSYTDQSHNNGGNQD
jgi:enamine deaminase RidA (YjgF/YER057c/UK114 family)